MLRKFKCLSTGKQACADSTLNEFTFENVTTALSASVLVRPPLQGSECFRA